MTNRRSLAILALCALLSTSADFGLAGLTASLGSDATRAIDRDEVADARLVARISERLATRRTSLSAAQRESLARTILREARAQGLSPDLVVAVIEVESAGHPRAVSHVGALGLMQILPATGQELAAKHGVAWSGPDTLFDPEVNVKLGAAYLRELTNRYGDVSIALAAYNWGPGVIDRRLRAGDGLPSEYIDSVLRAFVREPITVSRPS